MHILLLNDDALPKAHGGAAVVVDRLRRAYATRGHTVTLITTHQDKEGDEIIETEDDVGKIISVYRSYNLKHRPRKSIFDARMHTILSEIIPKEKPDVVHANNIHAYLTYNALCIARSVTPAVFLTAHDVFLVASGRIRSDRFRADARNGKVHRLTIKDHFDATGRYLWPLRNVMIRKVLNKSQAKVISISNALTSLLETHKIPVSRTIYNGVPIPDTIDNQAIENFRKKHNLDGPTIFFGGRVSIDKGIMFLLQAFKKILEEIPNANLLIGGALERIEPHLTKTPETVRSRIRLPGWLDSHEISLAYKTSDIVTTPSICFDPFNLMNIEAMIHGTPVVGTCFGGTPEIVKHEECGLIVDPTDTDAYSSALLTLLQDQKLREEMGAKAQERAAKQFTVDVQADAYLEEFESALANQM